MQAWLNRGLVAFLLALACQGAHALTATGSFNVVIDLSGLPAAFPPPTPNDPGPTPVVITPPVLPPVVVVPPGTTQPPPTTGPVIPPEVAKPTPDAGEPALPAPSNSPVPATSFARGTCLNQSLSSQAQASVRVICGSSQFVSIEPLPGQPFVGTHGGAYRFAFGPGAPLPPLLSGGNTLWGGSGTVTGLRLIDISGLESFLEMLVSF